MIPSGPDDGGLGGVDAIPGVPTDGRLDRDRASLPPPEPPDRRRVPLWQVAAGLAVSAFFLGLAVHRLDWGRFFACLARISLPHVALAAALTTCAYLLRGWRWSRFFARDEAPGWWTSLRVLLVGYAGNNLLPARAGEVLRAHALGRVTGLSRTRALVTVMLERIFDAASLVLMFLVALPMVGRRVPGASNVAWLGVAILAILLTLGLLLQSRRRKGADPAVPQEGGAASTLYRRALDRLRPRIDAAVHGLEGLGSRSALAAITAASVVIWSFDTASAWAVLSGFPQVHVPWDAALAATVIGNLGTVIPAGPSSVGTFEFAVMAGLHPYGYAPAVALGMAVVVHLLQFALTTATGLAAGISLRWEGARRPPREGHPALP